MNLMGWLMMRIHILQSIIKLFFHVTMIESIIDKANQVIRVFYGALMRIETRETSYLHDLHHRIK